MNRHGEVSVEKKTHILVVDDEQYVTKLVERTLEDAGFVVTVANDGNSALAMLAEKKPDLVLLDIRMPGLDGFQVLERIRESSNVLVFMLTAVRGETAVEHSLGLGADDYIEKPFLPRVLIARIQAKLRRARGELRHTNGQI
jgi:DNA-binding response OmpR family regulator